VVKNTIWRQHLFVWKRGPPKRPNKKNGAPPRCPRFLWGINNPTTTGSKPSKKTKPPGQFFVFVFQKGEKKRGGGKTKKTPQGGKKIRGGGTPTFWFFSRFFCFGCGVCFFVVKKNTAKRWVLPKSPEKIFFVF